MDPCPFAHCDIPKRVANQGSMSQLNINCWLYYIFIYSHFTGQSYTVPPPFLLMMACILTFVGNILHSCCLRYSTDLILRADRSPCWLRKETPWWAGAESRGCAYIHTIQHNTSYSLWEWVIRYPISMYLKFFFGCRSDILFYWCALAISPSSTSEWGKRVARNLYVETHQTDMIWVTEYIEYIWATAKIYRNGK